MFLCLSSASRVLVHAATLDPFGKSQQRPNHRRLATDDRRGGQESRSKQSASMNRKARRRVRRRRYRVLECEHQVREDDASKRRLSWLGHRRDNVRFRRRVKECLLPQTSRARRDILLYAIGIRYASDPVRLPEMKLKEACLRAEDPAKGRYEGSDLPSAPCRSFLVE